ncbi:hypothetical protein N7E81_15690 [Reichenbachiella carrageenanivorans]|uniref:Uncharacterized protein n=1 Tax=Reichenbachiella carrageenanivorans TaxID=2979869 RepID=A0ABY6CY11_9BACT|nr:hypothetical protein [Reichenbachiella carrageenanivorans]UXX78801.1 hypothetical protein N7E81_15690 [Reichenbachiella carrageenanivorans]
MEKKRCFIHLVYGRIYNTNFGKPSLEAHTVVTKTTVHLTSKNVQQYDVIVLLLFLNTLHMEGLEKLLEYKDQHVISIFTDMFV